jgi:hypothetical protein
MSGISSSFSCAKIVGGLARVGEALDVLELQINVLSQVRQEGGEIGVLPRLRPRRNPEHLGACDLRPQLGRHLARLRPVLPRDSDQRRVDGLRIELALVILEPRQQLAELVGDE